MKTVKIPDAYPLQWPDGWPRTPPEKRRDNSRYRVTPNRARVELVDEVAKIEGARDVVLSTNMPTRKDGAPYANASRYPRDPGAAIYWTDSEGRTWSLACDMWTMLHHNMRALYYAVAGIRQIERSGASQLLERAYRGFNALPAEAGMHQGWWRQVFGIDADTKVDRALIDNLYRALVRKRHPDYGGTHDEMVLLNRARDAALAEIEYGS